MGNTKLASAERTWAQMNDYEVAIAVIQGRLDDMSDERSPIAKRLALAIHGLRKQDITERIRPKCWWNITYTNKNGDCVQAREMPDVELERIGYMVAQGYYQGEIDFDADESEEYTT